MIFAPVKTKHATPPRILLHGQPKVGKSTFAASIEGVAFLPTEDGLNGIDATAIVAQGKNKLENYDEFSQALAYIENNTDNYKAVCIDSGDWLEYLIHQKVCDDHDVKTIEAAAGGYGKGYTEALLFWRNVLSRLDRLNQKRLVIIIICHSKAITFNDPLSEPHDVWEIKLHSSKQGHGALTLLKEWADIIGFASREKFVNTKDDKKTATETGQRLLHLEGSSGYLAGNRYSLPSQLPLDWQTLLTHILKNNKEV